MNASPILGTVIPAKAGIQRAFDLKTTVVWIPASAGMTARK